MKKDKTRPGYARILDAWVSPENEDVELTPVGCVATSYTFDAAFFEEECLARFAGLDSDPVEDPLGFLIEREEKLQQLNYAGVLVDQHHAKGLRSLRWDLLTARPKSGIQHAKVSLLLWSQHARLIVASANLTKHGYRQNHEVFAVLDYYPDSTQPISVLNEFVGFLEKLPSQSGIDSTSPAVVRWIEFLRETRQATRKWGVKDDNVPKEQPRIFPLICRPGRSDLFKTIREHQPDKQSFGVACVVSPFFDPEDTDNKPTNALCEMMHPRKPATLEFHVVTEPLADGGMKLMCPELEKAIPAARSKTVVGFKRLMLDDDRPLHAKSL